MKKFFFLLLFAGFYINSSAQKNYIILYNVTRQNPDSGKPLIRFKTKLIIKDSVSYQYNFSVTDDVDPPYGKRYRGHSSYTNIASNLLLYQSEPMNNSRYIVVDTIQKYEWKLFNEEKVILNHNCKKAICIYEGGIYFAFYTEDIPLPFGPWIFGGLPGVILELGSAKWPQVWTATAIKNVNVEIVQPAIGKKITPQQFFEILKN
ncbi:MAG TPA: GLPGLI family protein [Chitinophagaceae bacterium]